MSGPNLPKQGPESVPTGSKGAEALRLLEAQREAAKEAIKAKSKADRGLLQGDVFKGLEKMLEQLGSTFKDAKKHFNDVFEKVFGYRLFEQGTTVAESAAAGAGALSAELQEKLKKAPQELKKVFEKHPDWWAHLEAAEKNYGVPRSLILAVIKRESNFDSAATNPKSSSRGLGQFISGTWEFFRSENPNFARFNPSDPEASFAAVAWYLKKLSTDLNIPPYDPNAVDRLYMAYHEGPDRYRQFLAFQEGIGKIEVPSSYAEQYPTPEKYADFLRKAGKEVQGYAGKYADFLSTV